MNMIFIAKGTCNLGITRKDKDGNIVESTPTQFVWDNNSGSVAVGVMDPDTGTIDEETVSIFGDWDAAGYLEAALKMLKPVRRVNVPDLKAIVEAAYREDGNHLLCDYCKDMNCHGCIIREWQEEME